MAFVVDASVTMGWCFEDENEAYSDAVLARLAEDEAIVPSIWLLEVANVILVAERRHRLTPAQATRFLELIGSLPISVDDATDVRSIWPILDLGRAHNLSSYDAAYLELALREGVPLATLDERLIRAARQAGVTVLER